MSIDKTGDNEVASIPDLFRRRMTTTQFVERPDLSDDSAIKV
jgi:hypothetical protein